jgi:GNAT superfamily N-acetyltransferase
VAKTNKKPSLHSPLDRAGAEGQALKKAIIETQFSAGIESECSPLLADLVWQAAPELFRIFFAGDKSLLKKLFIAEWPSPVGFFSHHNMTIVTQNNRPVGLLNCFEGKRMVEIYQTHIQLVPSVLEASAASRVLKGLEAMGWLFPFVPHDALYILNLVVSPKLRGEGLGAKMMTMAEEKAKSEGLKSIHLDSATTSKAIKFYQHLGYQPLVETRFCQWRDDEPVPSHFRMIKPISG